MAGEGHARLIDAVIFDLGGVICDFDFRLSYAHFERLLGRPGKELHEALDYDRVCGPFERGEISPEEFVAHANHRWGSSISLAEFTEGWNAIFLGVRPGIEEVVSTTSRRVRIVLLSNTNAIHTTYWRERYATILGEFERIFASQEIGARKPEPEAFRAVLAYLNLPPSRVAFFDDLPPFVEGARSLGIRGRVVTDSSGIARDLAPLLGR